jgi:hypothetical protein
MNYRIRAKWNFAVKALQMRFTERLAFKVNRLKALTKVQKKMTKSSFACTGRAYSVVKSRMILLKHFGNP